MGKPKLNLSGKRFGKIVAKTYTHHRGRSAWRCVCDCGKTTVVLTGNLVQSRTRSCGCEMHTIEKDMMGQRCGRWTVVGHDTSQRGRGAFWHVICDCGNTGTIRGDNLRSGQSKSCGCLCVDGNTTHGWYGTPEYHIWQCIKDRCLNPRARGYTGYGGRGIRVCDRWRDSFEAFIEDMGPRPSARHSIDRRDNNGNYEPGNCRWATRREQNLNKRNTVRLVYRGESRPLLEWCDMFGLGYGAIYDRIYKHKWSVERALTTPVRSRQRLPTSRPLK